MSARAFKVDPYDWRVYFFRNREKWARATARKKFGTLKNRRAEASDAKGICSSEEKTRCCYVGVFDGAQSTLAHEMTHAAVCILNSAGVRYHDTESEALAWLVGSLVGKCSA